MLSSISDILHSRTGFYSLYPRYRQVAVLAHPTWCGLLSLYWAAVVIEMKHLTYTHFAIRILSRISFVFSQYSAVALQEVSGLDLPWPTVTSRLRR
jgi:hypothetical protein